MDTPRDLLPQHSISFRLLDGEVALGFNARCIVCGALFETFEDSGTVCAQTLYDERNV